MAEIVEYLYLYDLGARLGRLIGLAEWNVRKLAI